MALTRRRFRGFAAFALVYNCALRRSALVIRTLSAQLQYCAEQAGFVAPCLMPHVSLLKLNSEKLFWKVLYVHI